MKWLEVETLSSRDKRQLFELWNTEYPVNVAHESFEMLDEYLQSLKDPKHTLLFDHDGSISEYKTQMWHHYQVLNERIQSHSILLPAI